MLNRGFVNCFYAVTSTDAWIVSIISQMPNKANVQASKVTGKHWTSMENKLSLSPFRGFPQATCYAGSCVTKGSRKNHFAFFALRFGSGLDDPIEQNRRTGLAVEGEADEIMIQ